MQNALCHGQQVLSIETHRWSRTPTMPPKAMKTLWRVARVQHEPCPTRLVHWKGGTHV